MCRYVGGTINFKKGGYEFGRKEGMWECLREKLEKKYDIIVSFSNNKLKIEFNK